MKKTRRILVIALVLLLAASTVFASGASEASAGGKKKITVWLGWPSLMNVFDGIKADYEAENPNVELEITAYNLRDFEQKLAVSLPAGQGPDVIITSEYIIPLYVDAGLISEMPDDIYKFVEDNFDELVKSVNKFKGPNDKEAKLYGVPHIGIARVQYYNKDMMREAGLEPKAPETWDELIDDAIKMTKYDENGNVTVSGTSLRIMGGGSGTGEKFMIKLVQAGGSFLGRTADGGWKANYVTEEGIDALQLYIDCLYKYKVDSFEAKHDTDAFVAKQTAMFDRELLSVTQIMASSPDIDFGVAPMPGNKVRGTVYSTESYFVSEASKNKDTAWDFIKFCSREKYVKEFFIKDGWVPCRTDIDFSDVFAQYPGFKAAFEFPEGYKFWVYPTIPCADEVITKFAEGLMEYFKDETLLGNREKMRAQLQVLADETNAILKENGLLGEGPVVRPGDVIDVPAFSGYQAK